MSKNSDDDSIPSTSVPAREPPAIAKWRRLTGQTGKPGSLDGNVDSGKFKPAKWSLGVLNDKTTDEVPGSVLLMSSVENRNEPLGLRNQPARLSASSLPSITYPEQPPRTPRSPRPSSILSRREKKRTPDGQIILEPQPDESLNDPLNWPAWRRDLALISLGFYCMIGGGMTPILAAGFNNVASTYNVSVPQVALTTGLYMMGLGIGSVVASPTAILFGKRPIYLVGSVLFVATSVWCAASPSYASLVVARVLQGIAVSPVECLPSATIAEIFFLHERAYRIGIYTLLLLGGKNLVPLVSAVIIQSLGWRWVFWIVAMVVGFFFFLLFFFVPETFWDRTPRPKRNRKQTGLHRTTSWLHGHHIHHKQEAPKQKDIATGDGPHDHDEIRKVAIRNAMTAETIEERRQRMHARVGWANDATNLENEGKEEPSETVPLSETEADNKGELSDEASGDTLSRKDAADQDSLAELNEKSERGTRKPAFIQLPSAQHSESFKVEPSGDAPLTPGLHALNSPYYVNLEKGERDFLDTPILHQMSSPMDPPTPGSITPVRYTSHLQTQPARSFVQTLKPWNGRLRHDNWFRVAIRPFILFAYPAVLWSTVVYSLSVGWLIVLSESVSHIFRANPYNFSALGTGLVYLSPFIGGVLGTAVAGKVSDIIVRFMSRRNDGIYEPEFRLVMAIPVAICTSIGLMGYGWSAQAHDKWIVPAIFFGVISFGCSLGSTTAITFCVDSYRQYAGEALVTLNFSKNIFHGLVFSLFFNRWLDADGSKRVFVALGGIQLGCLVFTVPMYIYGKRARMWTVRKNLMEKF